MMQRLITLGVTAHLVADFVSMLTSSGAALTASLVLGILPASAALYQFVSGRTDDIAEFRAEPIRR